MICEGDHLSVVRKLLRNNKSQPKNQDWENIQLSKPALKPTHPKENWRGEDTTRVLLLIGREKWKCQWRNGSASDFK